MGGLSASHKYFVKEQKTMASTNKTPHLGLCQWIETDHFLMEDMNDTLGKIDTAIGGMSRVKLFDVTVTEAVPAVELDFTDIDLVPFAELELFCDFQNPLANMRLNGNSGKVYTSSDSSVPSTCSTLYSGKNHLIFTSANFIHRQDNSNTIHRMSRTNFPTLNSIQIFRSDNLAAGARVSVWGVKR